MTKKDMLKINGFPNRLPIQSTIIYIYTCSESFYVYICICTYMYVSNYI